MAINTQQTRTKHQVAFYVPKGLSPKFLHKADRIYAAYFLSLIHWKWICWKADHRGFVRLKHDYLIKVIPRDVYPRIRQRLEQAGVIEIDRTSVRGKRCWGYRITERYQQTRRIVRRDPVLIRAIRSAYGSESVDLPIHAWLRSKLDLIDFDMGRAEQIIEEMDPEPDSPMSGPEYRLLLREACQRITNEDHWLQCDKYGRVHTAITSLAKQLRCCLSIDDQPLVGLDLANSQPLIAGLVALQYYRDRQAAQRLRQRTFPTKGNPYHRRRPMPFEGPTGRPDLDAYLQVCESGQLYESLMRPGDDRNRVKRGFLTSMYGKEKDHWPDRFKDRLQSRYPSIARMLKGLKRRNHKHAAHVMQNVEATIFIHMICRRIQQEKPDLPILTIHDSILTVPTAARYVDSVIVDEFKNLGVHPTITMEHYE